MNRRKLLRTGAAMLAGSASSLYALDANNTYRNAIGIQLYTLRNQLKKDTVGTINAVAAAGYKQVECYGFPDCGPMIAAAKDAGLAVNSSHFAWNSVVNPTDKGVAPFAEILMKAQEAGISHLVIPYLEGRNRENLDGYKDVAEKCNAAAIDAKKAGIQLAYHNHAFEFQPMDGGKSGFDVLVEEFVPEMQFEVDVFWVKAGGVDPLGLVKQLKGRVSQLHLKDLKDGLTLPEFGKLPNDAFQELGDGVIAMEPIIEAAAESGVAHCHVEQDQSPDPLASIRQSIDYLGTL